jgi:hypothetical protein
MTAITIRNFGGIAPKTPPRYLQDTQAQIAVNCPTWRGSLQPLRSTAFVFDLTKSGTLMSAYRFGQELNSETQYWFHWASDVDVVRGFINGDTNERTYFTGDTYPKVTDVALALGAGTNYPINAYKLGVPKPESPPTVAIGGTPQAGAETETRVYVYTFVNSWDEESEPSGASLPIDVETGETVTVTTATSVTGAYNITAKRIYRSTGGSYLFVAEVPLATAGFVDSLAADGLGEECPSLTWTQPPDTLVGLVGLPGGFMAGFTGIDVHFCEPYRPFAWPLQYTQSVGYPVVGLGVVDTTLVVLTNQKPYFIQGSHPDSMTVIEADIAQACVSKRSIVSMGGAVYYASPDGLIAIAPGGSKNCTEALFEKEQWQSLVPSSIHGYAYEFLYVGFYDTGSVQGGFIYDTRSGTFTMHTMYATGGYADLKTDTLYLIQSNNLYKWDAGDLLTYQWKSKKFTLTDPISFTCYRVNAETYPVTFKAYRDGLLIHTEEVTNRAIRRLPAGRGHDWEVELSGTGQVFAVQLAQSPTEIASG